MCVFILHIIGNFINFSEKKIFININYKELHIFEESVIASFLIPSIFEIFSKINISLRIYIFKIDILLTIVISSFINLVKYFSTNNHLKQP